VKFRERKGDNVYSYRGRQHALTKEIAIRLMASCYGWLARIEEMSSILLVLSSTGFSLFWGKGLSFKLN